jgi:hypothetical protein
VECGDCHVAWHYHCLAAGLLHPCTGLLRVVVLVEVGDEHVGTFPAKAMATARPMPLSAPVITAALPASRPDPR